jgi:hypothetical protein
METTQVVNLEELQEKTSVEFVEKINSIVEHVNSSDLWNDKEIRFVVEEDQYTLAVLMCFFGNLYRFEYRFSTEEFSTDHIGWSDIRNFFDFPWKMKSI